MAGLDLKNNQSEGGSATVRVHGEMCGKTFKKNPEYFRAFLNLVEPKLKDNANLLVLIVAHMQ